MSHLGVILNIYPLLISFTYLIFLIFLSFFIYFKTKDIFDLSRNKALKYFRMAFLCLGISSLIKLVLSCFGAGYFFDFGEMLFDLGLFFNLLTIIYLTYSIFYHKFERFAQNKYSAILVAIFLLLIKEYFEQSIIFPLMIGFYFIFLFGVALFKYFNSSKKKKSKSIYLIYVVLFSSMFISNVLEFFALIEPILSSVIYLLTVIASIFLFIRILKELVI